MEEEQLFDDLFWVGGANKLPDLGNDPHGTNHLVDKYVAEYITALLKSRFNRTSTGYGWLFSTA